ncbi:flagellin [Cytobacillus horneckiae]|uniref:Flagellin n=1 Tax=Cytobacillus horneckiae TaxID=549687 RepID=A0A2N0ZBP8_9BACI|nr:flagellin [Cytobacillus horneckiae]NRG47005.1 flagellin [Bacillus sp. CRN 9]MBN6885301.1 flagellin [Cytobacillus horneckiae]MCM3178970.1 flagellin [Cytobacillus horneckiae]MEC1154186.1 flagellin [Cytobacillus horneckiae]MED2936269.1 flagellin [Cytobacillus horneckiae]
MIINNNISALNTYRQLGVNNGAGAKAMEKLSSGLRINRAGDDAAGLAISEKMRAQVRGLDQASRNSQDGISMIQTAEGALQETQNILQRMRELATQAANDTNVGVDRNEIQKEINELTTEINRISETTEFNSQKMLNVDTDPADAPNGFSATFQVGANSGQSMTINIYNMNAESLGLTGAVDGAHAQGSSVASHLGNTDYGAVTGAVFASVAGVSTEVEGEAKVAGLSVADHDSASAAVKAINDAIETVSAQRSNLGAFQNRLEHTISNLNNSSENLQAAESRIRDVDMAKEVMELTRTNILSQASQAMLAQANQKPQAVLQLLG